MKAKVYLETTIVSYLTAWRSPQLIMAAQQEATKCWWDEERHNFDLFISEIVVQEAAAGDAKAAKRRLDSLDGIPELHITDTARELAQLLIVKRQLPAKAHLDALHIAVAAANGMDYLLTWNCRHIANATLQHAIRNISEEFGCALPIICTPFELIEEKKND
ncbi:MAG: PIN domain-containing protein [Candidatus Electrothrix sp. AX2]|nr:PIN domain-containing protein [Candidatus Electrothrix gigas]